MNDSLSLWSLSLCAYIETAPGAEQQNIQKPGDSQKNTKDNWNQSSSWMAHSVKFMTAYSSFLLHCFSSCNPQEPVSGDKGAEKDEYSFHLGSTIDYIESSVSQSVSSSSECVTESISKSSFTMNHDASSWPGRTVFLSFETSYFICCTTCLKPTKMFAASRIASKRVLQSAQTLCHRPRLALRNPGQTMSQRPIATVAVPQSPIVAISNNVSQALKFWTWLIKRTFQPSIIRKKRKCGYLKRSKSVGGRKILRRRREKGRARLFGA